MMKRHEPTWEERVRAALLRNREQMRKARHTREFSSIYKEETCPICGRRNMSGVICRMKRGTVCMKHCKECEHFAPMLWQCTYRETEPEDMRKWLLIYGCERRDELWKGIYQRELLQRALLSVPKPASLEDKCKAAAWAADMLDRRETPKYDIANIPDENGDYDVIDTDTGEVMPFVAKFLADLYTRDVHIWACVQYLEPRG